MTAIHVHIGADGAIRALWHDELDLAALGPLRVRRASFVEFDQRGQCWTVREAQPHSLWRWVLQALLHRPMGRILHTATQRAAALAWEREHLPVPGLPPSGPEPQLPVRPCAKRYYVEDDDGHHFGPYSDYEEAATDAEAVHGRIIVQEVEGPGDSVELSDEGRRFA